VNKIFKVTFLYLMFSFSTGAVEVVLEGKFHEHYSAEVPVSGNVIAGIELSASNQNPESFTPNIFIPQSISEEKYLCFQVLSRDGTYNSKNTYLIPKNIENPDVLVSYSQSQHLEFLSKKLLEQSIAIKVNLGSCSENRDSVYLASTYPNASGNENEQLRIYIDSLGATDVKLAARDQSKKVIKADCQPLQGKRLTGFDYVCNLPISRSGKSKLDVHIIRTKHKRQLDKVKIQILL